VITDTDIQNGVEPSFGWENTKRIAARIDCLAPQYGTMPAGSSCENNPYSASINIPVITKLPEPADLDNNGIGLRYEPSAAELENDPSLLYEPDEYDLDNNGTFDQCEELEFQNV
jgi:hypothetical protein